MENTIAKLSQRMTTRDILLFNIITIYTFSEQPYIEIKYQLGGFLTLSN